MSRSPTFTIVSASFLGNGRAFAIAVDKASFAPKIEMMHPRGMSDLNELFDRLITEEWERRHGKILLADRDNPNPFRSNSATNPKSKSKSQTASGLPSVLFTPARTSRMDCERSVRSGCGDRLSEGNRATTTASFPAASRRLVFGHASRCPSNN